MKTIKLFALLMGIVILSTLESQAQEIGLRFGQLNGNNVAVDGIFATGKSGKATRGRLQKLGCHGRTMNICC
jgi:hypothetical protein